MNRFLLLIALAASAVATYAQERDTHGIINEQPAGDLRAYTRSGGATYAPYSFIGDATQDGIATQVVFSEDGTKAYFMNIISHAATATWVEGDVDGHTITVPLGQMVYWFDNGNYGMQLARIKVKGSVRNYSVELKGNVTFTIDGDDIHLEGTSGDPANNLFDGIGFVYTDYVDDDGRRQPAGEWAYYLDYATVLHYQDVRPVTPPEGLQTEVYSMEHESSGHLVDVAISGREVYIKGVSENRLPDSWMHGTINGRKLIFPLQYAGFYSSYLLYFCGADAEWAPDETGNWTWNYTWTNGSAAYDYDAASRTFATEQTIFASNSNTGIGLGETYHAPQFRPFTEVAATPADPSVVHFQSMGPFSILMLNVPLLDTEGRFIDPAKVSYQLFFDDDTEPFVFRTDEYKELPEDIDEVPYLYNDNNRDAFNRSYIYEKAYALYVFQEGLERIGVQTIYRGGGEERRSAISYYNLTPDLINDTKADATTGERHYDLMGRPVGKDHRGITITRTADGRVVKNLRR